MPDAACAMLFDGPGAPLRRQSVELPAPTAGEALVRIRMTTLCGSDLHTFAGRRGTPCPTILGHEILGDIAALPDRDPPTAFGGLPLRIDDRVVWSVAVGCGECFFCTRELPQKCERLHKYGHARWDGPRSLGGGLATHCLLLPRTAIYRVPDGLPDAVACPASCATATVAAALRHAGRVDGATVLILGTGLLGLTAAAMARHSGARLVLVADIDGGRFRTALRFGATHVDWFDNLPQLVNEHTEGRGADVVLEMSGSPDAAEASLALARIGGRIVWVGAVSPTKPVAVVPEQVVRRHLTITGVHNYRPDDLESALNFLNRTHLAFPFHELVAGPFPLVEADAAFAFAERERPIRVAVAP